MGTRAEVLVVRGPGRGGGFSEKVEKEKSGRKKEEGRRGGEMWAC